jgi:hypothetical protein
LASKIEAFFHRGHGDFLISPDMEDIIAVLDGTENIYEEISLAPKKVKTFLAVQFVTFLNNESFLESLEGNLRSPSGSASRIERIKSILKNLQAY